MNRLSQLYNVCIVVVNQVTSTPSGGTIPALGLSWSNCVSERYFCSRKEGAVGPNGMKFVRNLKLLTSSTWGPNEASFRIVPSGAVGLD